MHKGGRINDYYVQRRREGLKIRTLREGPRSRKNS